MQSRQSRMLWSEKNKEITDLTRKLEASKTDINHGEKTIGEQGTTITQLLFDTDQLKITNIRHEKKNRELEKTNEELET